MNRTETTPDPALFGCATVALVAGRVQDANSVAHEWMGRDAAGEPWSAFLAVGSAIHWETSIEPVLATEGEVRDVAVEVRGSGPALAFARRDGDVTRVLLVPTKARVRFEAAMLEAQRNVHEKESEVRHLQEIDHLRTEFINSIAHELGTPMTPIRLQASILRHQAERRDDAAARKALGVLDENLEKLERFHRSLLTAARLQAQAVGTALTTVPLDELVQEVVAAWCEEHEPPQPVRVDVLPARARVDRSAMETCIGHLLDNAVRFSGPEDPIHVKMVRGDGISIHVVDAGRGIEPRRLADLGKPFSKGHDSNEFTLLGAGLGLYIVTGLMATQGGRFHIHSPGPGLGTDAVLLVPEEAEEGPEEGTEESPTRKRPARRSRPRG